MYYTNKMKLNIVKSSEGKDLLCHVGYSYYLDVKSVEKNRYYWGCVDRRYHQCKARMTTKIDNGEHIIVKNPSEHVHGTTASDVPVRRANNNLKEIASTTTEHPAAIIRDSIINCQPLSRMYLPHKEAQKAKIKRVRESKAKEPTTVRGINIPDNLRIVDGEIFILSEKRFDNECNILMGTVKSLKMLEKADCWLMDGTFDVVPCIFRQLYTIFAKIDGVTVPTLFCLMTSKSRKCYDEMVYEILKVACDHFIDLKPNFVLADFEKASTSALKAVFPSTRFHGCFFHLGQIIWRRVQKEGMTTNCGTDETVALNIRMIRALAFLHPDEIPDFYKELLKHIDPRSRKIAVWFGNNYVLNNKRTNKPPHYAPHFWSVYDQTCESLPRTTNNVEAWHRRLQIITGKAHIGTYCLIQHLRKEYIYAAYQVDKHAAGHTWPTKNSLVQREKKIKTILSKKHSYSKIEYLRSIAYNLSVF